MYLLDEPEPNEHNNYVIDLLRDEFDEDFVCEVLFQDDEFQETLLKLAKGKVSSEEVKSKSESLYESAFENYISENCTRKCDDLHDPY